MEIDRVVELRTILKGKNNLPILVRLDNEFMVIDERNKGHFTIWDDTNGYLYSLRLRSHVTNDGLSYPDNDTRGQAINMFAIDYASIQALELPELRIDDIKSVLTNGIHNFNKSITEGIADAITNAYKDMMNPNRLTLDTKDFNEILGIDDKVHNDYYNGVMQTPKKETQLRRKLNEAIGEEIDISNTPLNFKEPKPKKYEDSPLEFK